MIAWEERERWLLLAWVLLAFVLRLYRLDAPALRGDEAFSVMFSRHPLGEMFRLFTLSTEPHPPLSFVVLHGWRQVAGESEFALRMTSLWAGVLVVPLIYVLSRLLWDRRVGMVTAALAAINPFYIWHAQETRMYALLVMFSVTSTILFWRILHERGWHWPVLYGLITACSIYTHYYTFLLLLFHGCYTIWAVIHRWRRGDRQAAKVIGGRWLLGAALTGVLYLPWLVSSWTVLMAYRGNARSALPFWAPVYRSLLAFGHGQTVPEKVSLWFLPLWAGLLIGGLIVAWRRERATAWFLSLYLALPWGIVFVDSLRRPAFDERYFMVSSPPFLILIALAWQALYCRRQAIAAVVAALILGISGVSLHNHYHNPAFARAPDWRALNAFFVERVHPDDVVIANYPDPATGYYYRFNAPWLILPAAYPVDRVATQAQLSELIREHGRIWLVPQRWPFWDADGFVEAQLDQRAERVAEYQIDRFHILLYHTYRQYATEMHPLDAQFEGGIRLLGYVLRDATGQAVDRPLVEPGGVVRLTLYWQAESPIAQDYVVFTHVLDQTGRLRGQQDNQPRNGTFPTRAWVPGDLVVDSYHIAVDATAPLEAYLIEVGMYRPADGERLTVGGADADAENRRVVIK